MPRSSLLTLLTLLACQAPAEVVKPVIPDDLAARRAAIQAKRAG